MEELGEFVTKVFVISKSHIPFYHKTALFAGCCQVFFNHSGNQSFPNISRIYIQLNKGEDSSILRDLLLPRHLTPLPPGCERHVMSEVIWVTGCCGISSPCYNLSWKWHKEKKTTRKGWLVCWGFAAFCVFFFWGCVVILLEVVCGKMSGKTRSRRC